MRPTKVLAAKLDQCMLMVDIGFNATCGVAISLIGLLSVASVEFRDQDFFLLHRYSFLQAGVAMQSTIHDIHRDRNF
jgi:hypothetical protein